jgi:phage FluMu protein Com
MRGKAMRQEEKDKLKKHGKLFCDFANAKTTDDILTSFFSNVQSVFNFSSDFTEKALIKYPTIEKTIGKLSDADNELLKMFLKRDEILISCNSAFNRTYFFIDKYDPIDSVFNISEMELYYDKTMDEPDYIEKPSIIPLAEIDKLIGQLDEDLPLDEIKNDLMALVNICNQIHERKLGRKTHCVEIENISKDYKGIKGLHNHLRTTQEKLKTILLQIIETENAYESEGFRSMLSRYNYIDKKILIINQDKDRLIEKDIFVENDFLKDIGKMPYQDFFNAPISYCFIEYLKHSEYRGKERLTVCQKCNDIFIKSKFYDYQFFCPSCSRKNRMTPEERASYMRGYRANPIVKKRERKR